jgi:tetratricopeptide (TPR) repeat protein
MPSRIFVFLTLALASPVWLGSPTAGGRRAFGQDSSERLAQAEQKARASYARGEMAFKSGRYQEALVAFEDGYASSPRPGFLLNIAHTWRKLGDLRQARAQYRKYLLIEPSSPLHDDLVALLAELDATIADEDQLAARPPGKGVGRGATTATPAGSIFSAADPAALRGSETPATIDLVAHDGSSTAPAGDRAAAFYRRTWFWIAVGVVAAGTGAGIYLWQHQSGGAAFQRSGTLGTLGAP